jgi:phage protein U
MAWSLNGTRIFVQKYTGEEKQIIAKLQPLSGGTIFQFFGYQTNQVKLVAKVVKKSNVDDLKALTITGTSYSLVSPEGTIGDFFVEDVSEDRNTSIYQSLLLTTGYSCTDPVYDVTISLLEDV